jgi:hypothetical protein
MYRRCKNTISHHINVDGRGAMLTSHSNLNDYHKLKGKML